MKQTAIDEGKVLGGKRVAPVDLSARVYSQAEIEQGVALNAALILKDPSTLRASLSEVQRVSDAAGDASFAIVNPVGRVPVHVVLSGSNRRAFVTLLWLAWQSEHGIRSLIKPPVGADDLK